MATAFTRGDFLAKNATAVITNDLTYVGDGGVDVDAAPIKSGSTTLLNNTGLNVAACPIMNGATTVMGTDADLVPAAVGGQVCPFPFHLSISTTAADSMLGPGGTATQYVPYKGGSVIGISLNCGAALTASDHVTVTLVRGATAVASAILTVAGTATVGSTAVAKDAVTFAADKVLGLQVETTLGASKDMCGILFVEM